ncbi:MAG: ABC transporter substrate-binding protein [Actinomycetota bacterium]|nr:ABC transporter substrate-binding protein [Actinomycetota bacterium]
MVERRETAHYAFGRSRVGLVGLVLVGALVAAACGSKVDPESLAATGGAGLTPYAEDGGGATGVADAPTDDVVGGAPTPSKTAAATTATPPASTGGPAGGDGGGTAEVGVAAGSAVAADGFAPGVTADTVRVGMHLPMSISGLDISSLLPLEEAVNAYWDARNREGGIHGREVEVFIGDDQYTPSGSVQACKTLVEQHDVFFVYGAAGADQIAACGQYTVGQGRPYLSAGTVEQGLLGNPNYWALTMTYEPMSALLAEYAVAELDGRDRPMAMLRMNTPNAESARRGFVTRARELGAEIAVDDAVDKDPNPSQLQATCIKMQQEGVELVYMMASGLVMAQAADACTSQGYSPQWLGVANTAACGIEAPLGSESLDGCITFSANHHPADSDSALQQQARADWKAAYPDEPFPGDEDPLLILVWAISDALREALEQTGPNLTVATFNAAMGGLVYDNQVLNPLDFRDGSHVGGRGVVLWQGDADAGRLVEIDSTWHLGFGG